jgi:hypothetical protein
VNKLLYLKRQDKLKDVATTSLIECDGLAKIYTLEGEDSVVALKDITLKGPMVEGAIKKG